MSFSSLHFTIRLRTAAGAMAARPRGIVGLLVTWCATFLTALATRRRVDTGCRHMVPCGNGEVYNVRIDLNSVCLAMRVWTDCGHQLEPVSKAFYNLIHLLACYCKLGLRLDVYKSNERPIHLRAQTNISTLVRAKITKPELVAIRQPVKRFSDETK